MVATRAAGENGGVRTRLIAAATRLFAERGFDATPIQAIADEVGLTKPALIHHFPSKEHLRREVLASTLAYWNETLPRLLLAATASGERFDAVFGEVYRFFALDPERARFIAREALDRPVEMRKLLRGIAPVIAAIAGYIRTGQEHGRHYEDVDPEAYVLHALQLVIGAAALSSVTAPALGAATEGRARYDRELTRIAKASLFAPRAPSRGRIPVDHTPDVGARKKRRRRRRT
ncbi:MAG TPA: helix-turn-helix domain-containing protein [Labilithrix sp.]|jgi:AcrR family transcriptional regulator|nr:helix-turn-helix domain-containing protein [Labilithrix sp.]